MNPGPKPKIYPSSLDEFAGKADYLFERDRREAEAREAAAREAAARAAASAPAARAAPPPSAAPAATPTRVPQVIGGEDIAYTPTEWVWPDRIARGRLTLLAGAPGSGKSTVAAKLVGALTSGSAWPSQDGVAPKGSVLVIAPASDLGMLIPRLLAAGTQRSRLHLLREIQEGSKMRPFDVKKDVDQLDAVLKTIADLRLVVIDALDLPGGRAGARATQALLEPLAALAERNNIAVLALAQPANADYSRPKPIALNASALRPASAVFLIERDPAYENRRLLLQVKNELAHDVGTLAFEIIERVNIERPTERAAGAKFAPAPVALTPRQITDRQAPGFNSAKAEAIAFLRYLFADTNQLTVREIEAQARGAGILGASQAISQCRALRDARMALGLIAAREGFGRNGAWNWAKPEALQPAPAVASPPIQPVQSETGQVAQAKN